ncbi:hypothetical protein [Burkholderia vietnamiensis]|uniref:hypothetical protein n=1 Tax=Burkholderia vietnamiensis TaxID=60552 RepID=UPI001B933EBE|nr:hypothetical protein [Burkholderia vietnamiensis]MBR8032443.1 hypothetical protein [Burkholderia vietnamiensis]
MGAESPRSFSEAKHAEFISYSDVMRTLMELKGESLEDLAKALKLLPIHKSHVAYLSGPELAVTKTENTDALEALLDETICSRRIAPAHYGFEGEIAKPHLNGWLHREFIFAMARARMPWPVTPDMLAAVEERRGNAEDLTEIDRLSAVETESIELRRHLDTPIASLADANARLAKLDSSTDVLAEMRSLRDEISRLKELAPPRPEFLIPIVVAVQKQFWADWDESKPRPKAKEEIQPWIRSNFPKISHRNALVQAVEKVACPFDRDPAAKK